MTSTASRALGALLLPLLCTGAAASAASHDFPEPINEVRVEARNGVPMILVDGRPVHPKTFFFNTGMRGGQPDAKLGAQVRAAALGGVAIHSYVDFLDWRAPGTQPDMSRSERATRQFLEANPGSLLIPRVWAEHHPRFWADTIRLPDSVRVLYADGSKGSGSLASAEYWDTFYSIYGDQVRAKHESEVGGRVLAYHFGGVDPEWINHGYRTLGPDYSEPSVARFREWLAERHGTDEALRAAWGRPGASLATAEVPREESWFPIRTLSADSPIAFFHDLPAERDWIDYKAFVTDLNVEHIVHGARVVAEATDGTRPSVTFYGYAFDLPGGLGGHEGMSRLLRSGEVDIFVSPISYVLFDDRMSGGPAGFMTAVDSVALHGKLWLNEDDLRTWLIDPERDLPSWLPEEGFGPRAGSFEETKHLLLRNFAAALVHRAGSWWMDLIGAGAFNDVGLWQALGEVLPLYEELIDDPFPYHPEVALIVDERSAWYQRLDYGSYMNALPFTRNAAGRSGFQVGYYYLDDFVEGLVPECRAYLFVNPWHLDDDQIDSIHGVLRAQGAMAIWQIGPGIATDQGLDPARASRVAGMDLEIAPGLLDATATDAFGGAPIPSRMGNHFEPRLRVVEADGVEVLARYDDDGGAAIARSESLGFPSVFSGGFLTHPPTVSRLFGMSGAHQWTRGGEIVHTDGRILAVHASGGGDVLVHAPNGAEIEALRGVLDEIEPGVYRAEFADPETRFFRVRGGAR